MKTQPTSCPLRPLAALFAVLVLPAGLLQAAETTTAAKARTPARYGQLPLTFEANHGQTAAPVNYLSRGAGYGLFLTPTEAVLTLQKSAPKTTFMGKTPAATTAGTVLRMTLMGANPKPRVTGREPQEGKVNYLIGNDPGRWRTGIPTYGKVAYDQVYPGIDLVFYGNQRQLEYDFIVAPGADPKTIRLHFDGADKITPDHSGDLVLSTPGGETRLHKPVVYQELNGERKSINGQFVMKGRQEVGFHIATWDRALPLVIDPVLTYSTYLGGTGRDLGYYGIAVDAAGHAYVTGYTGSADFPTTPGAFDTRFNGGDYPYYDAYVTKVNAAGSALLYSTYLGGSYHDEPYGIAVDAAGHAYVTGETYSSDFPTTPGAFDTRFNGGGHDAFVTQLNAAGSALLYSTFLGGTGRDNGWGIAVDTSGHAYVTGFTYSSDFPTTPGAFETRFNGGGRDAFVTQLNAAGSALLYSTFLGGTAGESSYDIAVDTSGHAYVTGDTYSADFPTTPRAFDRSRSVVNRLAFVTQLNTAGSALLYSTFLGGTPGWDIGRGIAVDAAGHAYVTGIACSSDFPTTPGAFQTRLGGECAPFVTQLNAAGSALLYSTFLGGTTSESSYDIAVDTSGHAYVTGETYSSDFPTTPGAFDTRFGGYAGDAFVTKLNAAGSALLYSTFLGGTTSESSAGIAVDTSGHAYVTGTTTGSDFPTTPGAFGTRFNGGDYDAFVTKLWPSLKPYCAIKCSATDSQGRKYIQLSIQDTHSGLDSVTVTQSSNTTITLPTFPRGTNRQVRVTATQVDPSLFSTTALDIRDKAGYLTHCDPTLTDISAETGTTFQQSFSNVPETENTLAIVNGWAGLKQLDVTVNGTTFQWDRLRSGEKRTLDLSSAMQPGDGNTISLQGYRQAGGRASLLLYSGP